MLQIDLPIFGAPMFLVSYPELVVAVSEAGGIGCFPSMNYRTTSELRDGLSEIQARTKKPIGVNIILFKQHNPQWYEQLKICLDFKVELIITSLGTPRSIVNEVKASGAKIFCDVTTYKHARVVAKAGADALIAVAQGAGGHAGAISPFALIPYLKKEIGLPIIAAGSISNGRQMTAAMVLGADAVYIGTRLIASNEAKASAEYKQKILEERPENIIYTDKISGIPANWLKKSVEQAEQTQHLLGDTTEKERKRWKDIFSAGHGVAQIEKIEPAQNIIQNMAKEYIETIHQSLPGMS